MHVQGGFPTERCRGVFRARAGRHEALARILK